MTHAPRLLHVITHVDFEGPSAIGDRAVAAGFEVRPVDLWRDPMLPETDDVERLVVMGGPMGAHDDDRFPFLTGERALLAGLAARGVPVLGVCLGAQLLAAALGAPVYRGPEPEIGAGTVRLHDESSTDPLLSTVGTDEVPVFHWHGDTFDLPDGATLLASSERYPHQAFRVGNAWGFQFHIELQPTDGDVVRAHLDGGYTVTDQALAEIVPFGASIIDRFLAL